MTLGRQPRRRQLKRIARTQIVNPQESPGRLSQFLHGMNLTPGPPQLSQALVGLVGGFRRQVTLPFQSSNGRGTLRIRPPPDDCIGILAEHGDDSRRLRLVDQQMNQC